MQGNFAKTRRRAPGSALFALVALCAASTPAIAQQPYAVPRLQGPVRIDGHVDEAAWDLIAPLPVVVSSPAFGAQPSEITELRLAYDDEFIYLAGRMYDSDATGVRATSLKRDETSLSNDWMVISLDTFRDRETTLLFGTNPAGVRTDAVFTNDATGSVNATWNTFWDAVASTGPNGWEAEIRIPLASLRFEAREGRLVMGATVWRRIARRNEMISWPAIEPRWGGNSIFKASQMTEIVLEGVQRRNPVYTTPYVLAGVGSSVRLNGARDAYLSQSDVPREAGFDLKYSPTSNLTVDLSVNTDFAQIEADDQQVNLTRFSLFFPEKRLFFQERSSVFDYALGSNEQLFYSRRIGLEAGVPARIYGGARVVGRLSGWDFGFLDMQAASTPSSRGANAGVLRLRKRVLNENSYIGAIGTSLVREGGGQNFVYGVDALLRPYGQDYLTLQWAQSFDDADSLGGFDRALGRLRWERRGIYGLNYALEGARVGQDFQPALGFISRSDYTRFSGRTAHGWRGGDASWLLRQSLALSGVAYRREGADEFESAEFSSEWLAETKSGHTLTLSGRALFENLERTFALSGDAHVPPGEYRFGEATIRYEPSQANQLRLGSSVTAGSFYDGSRVSASVSPVWNTSARLQLSGTLQWNRVSFSDRGQLFTSSVARLRTLLMFSSRTSATGFIQYSSANNAVVMNLRLRYNPREGDDLYLVYNHGLNTDRFAVEPIRPLTDNRAVLVKYSRTMRLPF